jgi:proteasome lid subunit RPN8/RPN11
MFTNKIQLIQPDVRKEAIEYCRSCLPNEGCGVIVDDKFMPFENKADKPENQFLINDDEFSRLLIEDKIQMVIHSHNNFPHASANDQEQQRALDIPFGIINFRKGTCQHFITWGDGSIEPLLMRPFFFGVFDCLTLSADYTKGIYGQTIPTPIRSVDYWQKDISLFEDTVNDKDYPIDFIDVNKAGENDFYFYKMAGSKYINHVGTIMPTGRILHHFINKVSCRLPSSFHQEYICAAGRYRKDWESN